MVAQALEPEEGERDMDGERVRENAEEREGEREGVVLADGQGVPLAVKVGMGEEDADEVALPPLGEKVPTLAPPPVDVMLPDTLAVPVVEREMLLVPLPRELIVRDPEEQEDALGESEDARLALGEPVNRAVAEVHSVEKVLRL